MNEQEIKQIFGIKTYQQRTVKQNRSLHLGLSMLADALNEAGLDQRKVLKPSIAIPWDMISIKEQLFKPILNAVKHKESTTEMDTTDLTEIWDILFKHLGERFTIEYIPFPSEENTENYLKSLYEKPEIS